MIFCRKFEEFCVTEDRVCRFNRGNVRTDTPTHRVSLGLKASSVASRKSLSSWFYTESILAHTFRGCASLTCSYFHEVLLDDWNFCESLSMIVDPVISNLLRMKICFLETKIISLKGVCWTFSTVITIQIAFFVDGSFCSNLPSGSKTLQKVV